MGLAATQLTTLATVHGLGEAAEKVGVVLVCSLVALAVLADAAKVAFKTRAGAMLGALLFTPVLLGADIWNTSQLRHLRHHPLLLAGAVLLGLVVLAALTLLFLRRPKTLPLLAVAALPFRLPIATGGRTSNLLIPLYIVVAAGVLASIAGARAKRAPRDAGRASAPRPSAGLAPASRASAVHPQTSLAPPRRYSRLAKLTEPKSLEWLLIASVLLYGLQACYSEDFSKALENVVFFYVPFALLFKLLRDAHWTKELLTKCFLTASSLAVAFAGVGFIEYERKQLFLNPKVVEANQYDNYFRVNSLFFDPSIYGRFLALVMIALTALVLWNSRRRNVVAGALALVWLWGGLVTSFSQSSIAALLLGLAVLAAYRWDVRGTLYASVALFAIGAVIVLLAPPELHIGLAGKGGSASNATSGRSKLVEGGLKLFIDRPLQGFGPGSFESQYRSHDHVTSSSATSASHTIPVTIAAEQGLPGLLLYLALLACAFGVLFAGAGRSPPRIALAACFAALVLHTWAYADFLEDPLTWTLLGIGIALAAGKQAQESGGNRAGPPEARAAGPAPARS